MDDPTQEALQASRSVLLSLVQLLSSVLLWVVTLISYRSAPLSLLTSFRIASNETLYHQPKVPRFTLQVLSWTGVITLEFNLVKVLLIFGVLTSIFSLWIKVSTLQVLQCHRLF